MDNRNESEQTTVLKQQIQEIPNVPWYAMDTTTIGGGDLAKGRDIKYGLSDYGKIYMKDRTTLIGNWGEFLGALLKERGVDLSSPLLVVGANDGQEISDLGAEKAVAMDVSYSALKNGKKALGNKLEFVNANARELPFGDKTFGNLLCLRGYQVFRKDEREGFLQRAKKVVQTGGNVIISVAKGYWDVNTGGFVEGFHVDDPDTGEYVVSTAAIQNEVNSLTDSLARVGYIDIDIVDSPVETFVCGRVPGAGNL